MLLLKGIEETLVVTAKIGQGGLGQRNGIGAYEGIVKNGCLLSFQLKSLGSAQRFGRYIQDKITSWIGFACETISVRKLFGGELFPFFLRRFTYIALDDLNLAFGAGAFPAAQAHQVNLFLPCAVQQGLAWKNPVTKP